MASSPEQAEQVDNSSSKPFTMVKFVAVGLVCVGLAVVGYKVLLHQPEPAASMTTESDQPKGSFNGEDKQVNPAPPLHTNEAKEQRSTHTTSSSSSSSSSSHNTHKSSHPSYQNEVANSSSEKTRYLTDEKVSSVTVQLFRLKGKMKTFFAPTRNKIVIAIVITLLIVTAASLVIRFVVLTDASEEAAIVDPVITPIHDGPGPPVDLPTNPPAEPSLDNPEAYAQSLMARIQEFFATDENYLGTLAAVSAAIILGGIFAVGIIITCTRNTFDYAVAEAKEPSSSLGLMKTHWKKIVAAIVAVLLIVGVACTAAFAPKVFSIYLLIGLYVVCLFVSALAGPIGGAAVFGAIALFGSVALIFSIIVYIRLKKENSDKLGAFDGTRVFPLFWPKLAEVAGINFDETLGRVVLGILCTFVVASIIGTMVAFFLTDLWWIGSIVIVVSLVAFFTVGRVAAKVQGL